MSTHDITRLGLKGDGIADGPVYAPRTLPGEEIEGEVQGNRIDKPRILKPSDARVKATCPHYNACGGCQLMHASDSFVTDWKRDVVVAALAAQGLKAPISGVTTSPANARRRATFSGRRLKSGAVVGFHAARSESVTQVPNCLVVSPRILSCLPALEDVTQRAGSRRGELSFAVTETDTGLDLAVTGGPELNDELSQKLPRFSQIFTRLTWNGEPVFTETPPLLTIGPATVSPPPGAFLQATSSGEQALITSVSQALDGADRILDLFAGCGTFTLPLATHAAVHAVEGEKTLINALTQAANTTPGLKPVTTECRDLFRRPLTPDELAKFDGVVIDPPRAGANAQTAELAKARIPQIAMVSCNPVTFASDAKLLVDAGYEFAQIDIVEQFRWSTHVELAATLRLSHTQT